jgi:isocitrate lyase
MAEYDANASKYTQSLGCWHGFVAQQNMIAVKSTIKQLIKAICIYPVGWLLPYVQNLDHCQINLCTKTSVPALIKEIYDFLRQADAIELNDLFRRLESGENVQDEIDNFETHIVLLLLILMQVLEMKKRLTC